MKSAIQALSFLALTVWGCSSSPNSSTTGDSTSSSSSGGAGGEAGTGGTGMSSSSSSGMGGGGGMMPIEIPANPFASHPLAYPQGSILPSNGSQAELDKATSDFYDTWKSKYLIAGCGMDRYYIETKTESGNLTVSEGHGYGMMLTAIMAGYDPDAQKEFDGLYWYFRDHPSGISPDLMSWYQDTSCANAQGEDSASDGDIDIAFSLLLADKQWGSCGAIDYKAEALKVIQAISTHELDMNKKYVLLGDWANPSSPNFYNSTRSSDFVIDHFRSYGAASGDAFWTSLVDSTHSLITTMQSQHSPAAGLLPDFIRSPLNSPMPAGANFLEGPNDGAYDYNACRDPWRLGTDYLVSGDVRAKQELTKLTNWIKGKTTGDPTKIRAGYQLDGTASNGSNYMTMAFVAPFGPAAMIDSAHQAWLDAIWQTTAGAASEGYYEDSIKLFSMIVMSKNWWAPEARPAVCNK
ncbi:MAG TPA: glycosyl hydrolase family 8 [Polyangium sp.]|nr:glycosyl hydrolase family 8 [Polyangium sp.]